MNKYLISALALAFASHASAINLDDSGSLTMTGFYQLTGAKVLSGTSSFGDTWQYQNWNCPCTMQNWEYIGVYEKDKSWQFDQESLVGVQFKKKFSETFSATAQLISRSHNTAHKSYTPTVDWAYVSWKPDEDSEWTLQAGRKRIPLYYYSDYLYIGYAYPWVRPAPDVYGWPIFTYDGVNASWEHSFDSSGWTVAASAWHGNFKDENNAYDTQTYYYYPTDEEWKKITGAWVNVSNGVVEIRGMLMTHRATTTTHNPDNTQTVWLDNQFTRIMGLAANVDYKNWIVRAEIDKFYQKNLDQVQNIYRYYLLGVGYKFGDYTPMITQSHYMTDPLPGVPAEGRTTTSLALRWDFYKNTALKVQYDISKEKSTYPYPFWGDSKLLSVSLQGLF
ncbi:hypothetical protein KSF73_08455 [Burkholderiaceae bacterium DAT-1]|nr:hypothetical protein [Burkholderiaceae bacterium DAT-1]